MKEAHVDSHPKRFIPRTFAIALTVTLGLAVFVPARAQSAITYGALYDHEITYVAANALLGSLSAGLQALVRGDDVLRTAGWGGLGGAISYVGIRTATRERAGLQAPGLLITAAGGSIVRNAAEGRPALSRFILPLGPVYLSLDTQNGVQPGIQVSARRLAYLSCLVVDGHYAFDVRASLDHLTPVFRTSGDQVGHADALCPAFRDRTEIGMAFHGSVIYAARPHTDPRVYRGTFGHEMGHIAQSIRDDLVLNYSTGRTLSDRVGAGQWLILDFVTPLRWASHGLEGLGPSTARWQNSWYEREVRASQGRRLCGDPAIDCHW